MVVAAAIVLVACSNGALPGPVPATGPTDLTPGATAEGSGATVTETREIRDVTAVELGAVGQLLIEQTGTESLTVEAEPDVLPLLGSDVSGGVLRLGPTGSEPIRTTEPITYRLTVRSLDAITIFGAGNADVTNLQGPSLRVEMSGAGTVTVAGTVEALTLRIEGAGSYDGENLQVSSAEVTIDGAGAAVVQVSDRLDVTVSGVGSVEYIGDPEVTEDVSGLGSVGPR